MSLRPWFWVHMFLMWFTLAWSGITTLMREPPPPLLLLMGIIQALIVQREWENSAREHTEKGDSTR